MDARAGTVADVLGTEDPVGRTEARNMFPPFGWKQEAAGSATTRGVGVSQKRKELEHEREKLAADSAAAAHVWPGPDRFAAVFTEPRT
jgi:hypothetical protein